MAPANGRYFGRDRRPHMQAIQFLKTEHQKAKAAFGKVLQAAPGERRALWEELKPELKAHEQMEDQCVYGPVSEDAGRTNSVLANWKQRHDSDVKKVEGLMSQTEQMDPQDARWLSTVQQIHSSLEAHIREEESEIFPAIGQVWDSARLERAGEKMAQMKQQKTGRAA
jgi:iron-sulfur cluster repair protein YtfE (RIC family)